MIMLHSGLAEESMQTVYGYALQEGKETYLVLGDGTRVRVRRETVMPFACYHRIVDYICLPGPVLAEFYDRGAYFLEEIAMWDDDELEKIKGIGRARRKEIRALIGQVLSTG